MPHDHEATAVTVRTWCLQDKTVVEMSMANVYQTQAFLLERHLSQAEGDALYMLLAVGSSNLDLVDKKLRPIHEAWTKHREEILAYKPPPN